MHTPTIYFYVSPELREVSLQEGDLASIIASHASRAGELADIVQTCRLLKDSDLRRELVDVIPSEGIVVGHLRSFPPAMRPSKDQLVVCAKGAWDIHRYAQLHITQEPHDMATGVLSLWRTRYISHYPQRGLIERSPARGAVFQNLAYLGASSQSTATSRGRAADFFAAVSS